MTEALFSIVMPAFNRARYVTEAVESVLAQSLSRWELIAVNDGSTDETPAILDRFAAAHPDRIRVIHQPNAGVVAARNAAIRVARCPFVAFIDSDDAWYPTKLARQLPLIAAADPAFVYTGYDVVDAQGNLIRKVLPDPRFEGRIYERLWTESNEIVGATLVVKRQRLLDVGMFDARLGGAENLDLRLKLARTGDVRFVGESLYKYRKHDASLTANADGMIHEMQRVIENAFEAEPTAEDAALRRRVWSIFRFRVANHHFERAQFARAIAAYARAWPASDRRLEIAGLMARCLIGRPGNAVLRALKRLWS